MSVSSTLFSSLLLKITKYLLYRPPPTRKEKKAICSKGKTLEIKILIKKCATPELTNIATRNLRIQKRHPGRLKDRVNILLQYIPI